MKKSKGSFWVLAPDHTPVYERVDDSRCFVRFSVTPPLARTPEPHSITIRLKEGHIDVRITDEGELEIRGSTSLKINPQTSNTITISLEDFS